MKKVLILILSSIYLFSQAQETGVYATVDTSQILIGDQINYTVTCIQNEKYDIKFPQYKDTIIKGIEIVESLPNDTTKRENNQLTIEKKYIITAFDTGAYMLPVGPFILDKDTILGKSVFLSVNTMEVDTAATSIKPIKLPYTQGYTLDEMLPWILIVLGILIVLAIAYFVYSKYFKKDEDKNAVYIPKEPAHIIAYRALDRLKTEQLWEQEKYKEYYTKLTDALRIYIDHKYKLNAMEQTSDETIIDLEQLKLLNTEIIIGLKTILTTADLVKFAKYSPKPDENVKYYDMAYDFVNKTKLIDLAPIFSSEINETPNPNNFEKQ